MKTLFWSAVALALTAATASANYLSYIDDKGTRHIVKSAEEIPEKYREVTKESRAGDPSNAKQAMATKGKTEEKDAKAGMEAKNGIKRGFGSKRGISRKGKGSNSGQDPDQGGDSSE
ncbi:MAG: hypothetical protein ACXVB9_14540 [Bdellovibrionota bacterium]